VNAGKQYLRAAEIAALTGMSLRTIRRWIKDEVLPATKVAGARLVATEEVKAALSAPRDVIQETSDDED
jgi:excisionase family DNA binding protein